MREGAQMKKFRVMYRASEHANDAGARTEDVVADGWRVDSDKVLLYKRRGKKEVPVFDVPKKLIMRIHEV